MVSVVSAAKWFFVILFAFLLWANVLVFSLLFPVQSVALDRNVWFSVVEKIDAYESFVPLVVQELGPNGSSGIGVAIPSAALEPLVRESFSREWLNAELKKVVSNYFDFVEGKTDEIDFSFSLLEPKQKMAQVFRENGVDSALLPLIETEVQQVPDRFELVSADESVLDSLMQQRTTVSLLHQAVLALFLMALICILAIAALLQNQSALLVFGIVFLLAGLLVLLASQALSAFIPTIAAELQSGLQTQFRSASTIDFEPVLAAFLNPLAGQLLLFGIVETVLGIAGIGGYWFLRKKPKPVSSA